MKNICDWENCKKIGSYKAPIERDNSRNFRFLCLEHIKIFNKNWNYFSNMNNDEIEYFIKSDLTWHKPTKSFASSDNFFKILWNNALKEDLSKNGVNKNSSRLAHFNFSNKDLKAFEILGLDVSINWDNIRTKFKKLVKKFHPDMNSGDKKFEEKLKVITLAYTQLKRTLKK